MVVGGGDTACNILKGASRWDIGNTLGHLLHQIKVCVQVSRKRNLITNRLRMQTLSKGEGSVDNEAKTPELVYIRLELECRGTIYGHWIIKTQTQVYLTVEDQMSLPFQTSINYSSDNKLCFHEMQSHDHIRAL